MFYKLRLKLTFINAAIIAILFLLLTAGTYYSFYNGIVRHSEEQAKETMSKILAGSIVDLPSSQISPPQGFPPLLPILPNPAPFSVSDPSPPPKQFGPYFFFVKCSSDGTITFQSSNQPLSSNDLTVLTGAALQNKAPQGTASSEKGNYPYLRAQREGTAETIILFQDFTHENQILRLQLTALISTGIFCLLLALAGSFFMAKRALVPVQAAWQQQKNFLSDASHELRTPLAVIQTNLEIVLANPKKTVASQGLWLQNIQEESAQMANLVTSLLFLARADSNQQPIEKQLFSFTSLIARATAAFEPVAKSKNLELHIHDKPDLIGYGDEAKIKQVITILLDNAIRHTPSGGKITISLARLDSNTVLTIADSGEGIIPEALDRIFDRFYQADTSRNKGGAGLGLSIAKWIVENHHGTIEVASKPSFGTTFTVQLPGSNQPYPF